MKRVKINVKGKVQGVGFRYAALYQGQALGLKGYVRNQRDGSVELDIQGDEAAVEQMITWCYHGPQRARVDSVETDLLPLQSFSAFQIW